MSLQPEPIYEVPEDTARVAFPRDDPLMRMRDELSPLWEDIAKRHKMKKVYEEAFFFRTLWQNSGPSIPGIIQSLMMTSTSSVFW